MSKEIGPARSFEIKQLTMGNNPPKEIKLLKKYGFDFGSDPQSIQRGNEIYKYFCEIEDANKQPMVSKEPFAGIVVGDLWS